MIEIRNWLRYRISYQVKIEPLLVYVTQVLNIDHPYFYLNASLFKIYTTEILLITRLFAFFHWQTF